MKCKLCQGPCELIGKFGQMSHYRCRHCGMWFNKGSNKPKSK